jgi:hypothetical protein
VKSRLAALLGLSLALSACAIPTRQTDALLAASREARDVPDVSEIAGVPFVLQDKNYCGPASLAMVMAFAGKAVPVDTLASQVYTPGKSGTLQVDLLGSARRNGLMAVEIHGLPALLHEIHAGHPVVTFENLGLSWYPKWHYAVAYGYDLAGPTITLHSGPDRGEKKSLRKFERAWIDSGSWGLVVLQPGQLAATVDDLAHVRAAAGLEQLGLAREAELAYASILGRWPTSLGALIGMGNLRYAAHAPHASAAYLKRAVAAHPDSAMAWHNLATAQGAAHQRRLARVSAARALALAGPETASYRASLREWL